MVLDAKVMEWATQQGLDTATLKKAKVPIYGKWYFPELPSDVPLVNLRTGQVEAFGPGYRAGAILYVKEEELKRAGLGPYKAAPPLPAPEPVAARAVVAPAEPAPAPVRPTQRSAAVETVATAAAHGVQSGSLGEPVRPAREASHAAGGHADADHAAPGRRAEHGGEAVEHAHPTPAKYIQIAVILAIITSVEVALYYVPGLSSTFLFWTLILLSVVKFFFVAGYFMHLKFDHVSFTGFFAGGMALAVSIFLGLFFLGIATRGFPSGY